MLWDKRKNNEQKRLPPGITAPQEIDGLPRFKTTDFSSGMELVVFQQCGSLPYDYGKQISEYDQERHRRELCRLGVAPFGPDIIRAMVIWFNTFWVKPENIEK